MDNESAVPVGPPQQFGPEQIRTNYTQAPADQGWGTVVPSGKSKEAGGSSMGFDHTQPLRQEIVHEGEGTPEARTFVRPTQAAQIAGTIAPAQMFQAPEATQTAAPEPAGFEKLGLPGPAETFDVPAGSGPTPALPRARARRRPAAPPPLAALMVSAAPVRPQPAPVYVVTFAGPFGELSAEYDQVFLCERQLVLMRRRPPVYKPPLLKDPNTGEPILLTVTIAGRALACYNTGIHFQEPGNGPSWSVLLVEGAAE